MARRSEVKRNRLYASAEISLLTTENVDQILGHLVLLFRFAVILQRQNDGVRRGLEGVLFNDFDDVGELQPKARNEADTH